MLRIPLEYQILIGLLFGVLFGLFFGDLAAPLDGLGQAYIMLLKMPILLFMSFSLIYAIGNQGKEGAKTLFKFGALMLVLVWGVTLSVVYLVSTSFPSQRPPPSFSAPMGGQVVEGASLLELFIPLNPIHAFTYEIVPAIVVFSLLFGVMLIGMPNKKDFLKNLNIVINVLESIANWVAKFSPIGVFALIAAATGTIHFEQFSKIQVYFFAYLLGTVVLSLWIFPLLVSTLTGIPKRRFLKEMQQALLLAFSTGNLLITLPLLSKALEKMASENEMLDEDSQSCINSIVPIAYNFPTTGNLMVILFLLFVSFFYSVDLSFYDHLKLNFLGIPSLFGPSTVAINAVSFLSDQLRLPIDSLTLYLETMPFTRNFHILSSCAQIGALGILVMYALKKRLTFQTKSFLLNLFPILIVLLGTSASLRNVQVQQMSLQAHFSSLYLIEKAESAYLETSPVKRDPGRPLLEQIKESKKLIVGVNPHIQPFCYFNKKKDLVGFDVALAHKLALDLGVEVIFVPFKFQDLGNMLEQNSIDIAMTAISVNEERLKQFLFTQPYNLSERVFLTLDHKRHQFKDLYRVQKDDSLKIAVLEGSSFEPLAKTLFPQNELVLISDYDQFLAPKVADALFWSKDMAINYAKRHPKFSVVTPTPTMGRETFAYAVPLKAPEFKAYLDYWLDLKELEGFMEQQQKIWVRGEYPEKVRRWSIIKNVLHWVD